MQFFLLTFFSKAHINNSEQIELIHVFFCDGLGMMPRYMPLSGYGSSRIYHSGLFDYTDDGTVFPHCTASGGKETVRFSEAECYLKRSIG